MTVTTVGKKLRAHRELGPRLRRSLAQTALYLIATVLCLIFLLPFFWAVSSAFKGPWELFAYPPTLFPQTVRWQNFVEVFTRVPYSRWVLNSFYVCALAVSGQVFSAALVAYGFSRFQFPGRDKLFMLVLSTMMLPEQVTIIPLFLMYRQIRWLDTLKPLWVPQWFGGGAFYVFLLRQFFLTIPLDFDESAEIDGAGKLQVFFRILLPLSRPALASVVIFSFLGNWNSFFQPLFFLNTTEKFTLPLGLRFFQTQPISGGLPKQHLLMAASTMITLPIVIVFFLAQRHFIQGVVMTGLKG